MRKTQMNAALIKFLINFGAQDDNYFFEKNKFFIIKM